MPKVPQSVYLHLKNSIAAMEEEYNNWRPHYQDLAKYILPRRYEWLQSRNMYTGIGSGESNFQRSGATGANKRNEYILDPTATKAVRDLAAGMFNGVTSPARPWFRLRFAGFDEETMSIAAKRWLDETQRRMLQVMAESNFYSALAIQYLDLGTFGTAATLIYEDFDEVIRCYNVACGEYRISQDDRKFVNRFSRTPWMTTEQIVNRFGLENCSEKVQQEWKQGGNNLQKGHVVCHIIEPNDDREGKLPGQFDFREYYFEKSVNDGRMLSIAGFKEKPGMFARWELVGSDTYGTSPCMDALPDIIQLQHETKAKGKSLDYMNEPPIVADQMLQHRPTALMPRGITYVPSATSVGAKPIYTVNPPLQEMNQDIGSIQMRVKETLHNDLFRMISNLDTVRSATEIDARREEKLVLLGSVLQRNENEALDPAIQRIFNIMKRKNLLPEIPREFEGASIEVQYVSILSDAQRAVGTASMERFAQFLGELGAAKPEILEIPDWAEYVREYGDRLNVPAKGIKPRDQVQAEIEQRRQAEAQKQAAEQAVDLTQATRNLSETNLGGGRTAIDALIG